MTSVRSMESRFGPGSEIATGRLDIARVVRAGLLVGVLDGMLAVGYYAIYLRVATAARVFQGVASALVGRSAFNGGSAVTTLGVATHFTVALTWATVYGILYHRSATLRRLTRSATGAIGVAILFGMFVWLAMDLVVIPMTRAAPAPVMSARFLVMLLGHPLSVGLPIAFVIRDRARG